MRNRSENFWLVGFFLSKYGNNIEGEDTLPPIELGVSKWNSAYHMFYDSLSDGRAISTFEHSLKNARDAFDSHLQASTRIGWRDKNRGPRKLESVADFVFKKHIHTERKVIWQLVKQFANSEISEVVVNDLQAEQESSQEGIVTTKTEGGQKAVTIFKYERNIALRSQAFKTHGYNCAACGFNFEKYYGAWGRDFGEVHHLHPLSENSERDTNPERDLAVLCANCHRMIHRKKGITLTIEELKQKINDTSNG